MGKCEVLLEEIIKSKYQNIHNFSEASKIPDSTIRSVLKRDFANCSVSVAFQICDALDCDLEELLQGRYAIKKQKPKSSMVNEIVKLTNELNEIGQLRVKEEIDTMLLSGKYAASK